MQNHAQSVKVSSTNGEFQSFTHEPELRFLDNRTVDVFFGKGWGKWSRFQKQGRVLKLVKGENISHEQYGILLKILM